MKCRGSECTVDTRCNKCVSWTEEEMIRYVKLCKSLSSKSKRNKSSPPRSIPPERDTDAFNQSQLVSVQRMINDSVTSMSDKIMAKFSSMMDQFQSRQHDFPLSSSSAVPGQSATRTEPASRLPTDRITCPAGRRFRKGHEDTVPQEDISVCDIMDETPETSRHPPGDAGEPQELRRAPAFVRHHQSGAGFFPHTVDEDDDERLLEAEEPQFEKSFGRLLGYIQDRFPHSIPSAAPREPPRCEFENFFSTSENPPSAKPILNLYPRVNEILDLSADRAAQYARESKPLHRLLPLKRRSVPVGDQPDFCLARLVNPDFSRISRHKKVLRSRASSMTLSDLERLDRTSRSIIAGQSQSFWLLSALLAQLKDEGYRPADPNLFDQSITALSASLASQTSLTSAMSGFVTAKRRESYLAHVSCPVGDSVKRELLVALGTESLLFNQPLLEKVVSNIKEDSLISSTASLASLSKAALHGRSGAPGSRGSSSPLDFSRPSTSGLWEKVCVAMSW